MMIWQQELSLGLIKKLKMFTYNRNETEVRALDEILLLLGETSASFISGYHFIIKH